MTSRERVLQAIQHKEPDRLPLFKPNTIDTYEPFNERIQHFFDHFEFDRFAGLGGIVDGPSIRRQISDDTLEDGYGCRFQYKGVGSPYCIRSPLANAQTVEQVKDHVKEVIDILAPGGGYLFKAQAISPLIPVENVLTTYELGMEYGRYNK